MKERLNMYKLLPDIGYPQTDEIAEAGVYACMNCPLDKAEDEAIIYLYQREKLPKCPICGITYWFKV